MIVKSNAVLYGVENYEEQKREAVTDMVMEMKPGKTEMACNLPVTMVRP